MKSQKCYHSQGLCLGLIPWDLKPQRHRYYFHGFCLPCLDTLLALCHLWEARSPSCLERQALKVMGRGETLRISSVAAWRQKRHPVINPKHRHPKRLILRSDLWRKTFDGMRRKKDKEDCRFTCLVLVQGDKVFHWFFVYLFIHLFIWLCNVTINTHITSLPDTVIRGRLSWINQLIQDAQNTNDTQIVFITMPRPRYAWGWGIWVMELIPRDKHNQYFIIL